MVNKACSDTGPILHLNEINKLQLLRIFQQIYITSIIEQELTHHKISILPKSIQVKAINKDQITILAEKYELDLGESSIIWLCKSENIPLILTDDLEAREVSSTLGLQPIGTIGIITRCFREKVITKTETIKLLKLIFNNSTLFVTSDLINYVISEIEKFKE